ncbi:preprotein translocase subunit Sec61beta [archaeon]|nr:preprotein translocase subunit Sec61beta [archaeon]|tara:strand:- start:3050 stop:3208 length:159 start_codon:yes stop_codon:yes gene_type:complete
MADEQIRMPSSGGGLVRYFEDYKSKIEFSPYAVIVMIVIVIFIEILIHTLGK